MRSFGSNLQNLRKYAGYSQREFAELVGTTQQHVSEWECGKVEPTLSNIVRILCVLEITFEELIEE